MTSISNSANLIAAESAIETLSDSLDGIRVTMGRAKAFRAQLRSILGVEQSASVVDAVRLLKSQAAANAAAPANAAEKLAKAKEFRQDLRRMLGVPRRGSVTVKVRELLAENARLKAQQEALAGAIRPLVRAA